MRKLNMCVALALMTAVLGVTGCRNEQANAGTEAVLGSTVASEDIFSEVETSVTEDSAQVGTTGEDTSTEEVTTTKEESTAEEVTTAEEESTTEEVTTTEEESTTEEVTATEEESTTEEVTTTEEETTTEEVTTTEEETTTEEVTTTEPETTTEAVTEPPTLSYEERQALIRAAAQRSIPGIVCWGDSLTYGFGGNGMSYPTVLSELISNRLIDGIEVVNNGVCIETTYSIMARADAVPMYSYAFNIPSGCDPVQIEIVLEGGHYINFASNGDVGLNPVTIAGVKGNIKACYDDGRHGLFYFTRLEAGESVAVENYERVYSDSIDKYNGYINIIFMGQNGTYTSNEHLVEEHKLFVNSLDNDRYIIIGLTTGSAQDRADIENRMQEAFGDKYINMRQALSTRGLELAGIGAAEADGYYLSVGMVPISLKSDDVHLNDLGYKAMAHIIYERLEQLGYFNDIKNAITEYNY